jgi:predicted metal-dependent peptidase
MVTRISEVTFAGKIKEKGQIKFSVSSLNDKHIKDAIDFASKTLGVTPKEIIDKINKETKKVKDFEKVSPMLYETIAKNIIEDALFEFVEDASEKKHLINFDPKIFAKLIRLIKIEHDQFFPLRNFIENTYLKNPVFVLIPTDKDENKQFNDVDTACATPDGKFVFNVKFMQSLMNYAVIKNVAPQGKKYASNGGPIPDAYCYIEFLIMHELMHYTYADFYYQDLLDADHEIINWVGDFRTNYLLVKSGYEQLPIGLFSDDINYDRQTSYTEMYEIVKREFDKLNKNQKDTLKELMSSMSSDSHVKAGKPGDKNPSKIPDKSNSADRNKREISKIKGKPAKEIAEQMDKHAADVQRKLENSKDTAEDKKDDKTSTKKSGSGDPAKGGRSSSSYNGNEKFDYESVRPTFTWKRLLSKMITDASNKTEETYEKPNRRNISSVYLAAQTGAAPIKPGEKPGVNESKLAFVVDSSGSMTFAVPVVYSNINALMKSKSSINKDDFYLLKFSGSHVIYKCNFGKKQGHKVDSVKSDSKSGAGESIKTLFETTFGSSTNFDDALTKEIRTLAEKRYNILIMSDGDILDSENYKNFISLVKDFPTVFIIFDSKETYTFFIKKFGKVPRFATYFEA